MKSPFQSRVWYLALVMALAAVLVLLALLQYRWSGEVSQAASLRMQTDLHSALNAFRQDLHRELAGIGMTFEVNPEMPAPARWTRYAQQLESWKRTAAHPELVAGVYVWQGGSRPRFSKLNRATAELEPAAWPPEFDQLRAWLQERTLERPQFALRLSPREGGRRRGFESGERRRPPMPWMIAAEIPALVSPVLNRSRRGAPEIDWIIVALDNTVLRGHIFPELVERHFGGPAGLVYRVAIVADSSPERRVLYASDAGFGEKQVSEADATMNLFGPPLAPGGPRAAMLVQPPARLEPNPPHPEPRHDGGHPLLPRFESIRYAGLLRDCQLIVQHRNGSLESVVAGLRRRNLAISFGVLLVLAATMAVMVITSHRAQRLAKLQMDFVAAVSHELRTPLAVISSAAENMADGVVHNQPQMARYGEVIKGQTRQLTQLVEQVLRFAATREKRNRQHVRVLGVGEIVDTALAATADLVRGAGFIVDKQVEPNLPGVKGDLAAVSQALQNLITNAVKYAGERRWIGIRARLTDADGKREVQISVQDKGVGIAASELESIFEPFYRSAWATATQIHGTGLGLPLARSIAEAMGGRLTVASEVGQGSVFVLHLPAVDAAFPLAQTAAAPAANVS